MLTAEFQSAVINTSKLVNQEKLKTREDGAARLRLTLSDDDDDSSSSPEDSSQLEMSKSSESGTSGSGKKGKILHSRSKTPPKNGCFTVLLTYDIVGYTMDWRMPVPLDKTRLYEVVSVLHETNSSDRPTIYFANYLIGENRHLQSLSEGRCLLLYSSARLQYENEAKTCGPCPSTPARN
jgi:hypothetical protein